MNPISGASSGPAAAVAQHGHAGPRPIDEFHGRNRTTETTAEIHKADKNERSKGIDITV